MFDAPFFSYYDLVNGIMMTYNKHNEIHSYNDKPALDYDNGTKVWYKNGVVHRDNGPAIIDALGKETYCKDGKYL